MTYNVFISHSMAASDRGLLKAFVGLLEERDVLPYVAERDPIPGEYLWVKIEKRIKSTDLFAVLWTVDGAPSQYLNQEVGAAFAAGRDVLPIVEKGVRVKGALEGREYVEFDRQNPDGLLEQLRLYFARLRISGLPAISVDASEAFLMVAALLIIALVVVLILVSAG